MTGARKSGELVFDLPEHRKNVARYMWSLFSDAVHLGWTDLPSNSVIISTTGKFPITESFDDFLDGNIARVASRYDLPEGLESFRKHEPLACAFYLINSLHERLLPDDKFDKYGRYPYRESIQYANDLIEKNYVQTIFRELYYNLIGQAAPEQASKLFWTHDIDYLYSAWKSDLILAWRKANLKSTPHLAWRALTSSQRWNNIPHILELEKEYDIRSVFFWLTQQGKAHLPHSLAIDHADYDFKTKELQKYWHAVLESNSRHGIHKSAFPVPLADEVQALPAAVNINRNHFLKFRLPDHYDFIEKSGIRYDSSLGFAEHFGFRNSYGRPFRPYHLPNDRPYSFVEYPLHLMDATFLHYMDHGLESMVTRMIRFIQEHRHDSIIGILIHNSSLNFQKSGDLKIWKKWYESLREFDSILPSDL